MVSLLDRSPWSDDDGLDEKEPMLGPQDQFSIEEADSSAGQEQSKLANGRRWMNSKFSRLYIALVVLGVVTIASLAAVIVLLVYANHFADRLEAAQVRGQNGLAKAFNTIKEHLDGKAAMVTNTIHPSAIEHLSPEQVAQAKAAGLIAPNFTAHGVPIEPHVPKPHVPVDETTWKKDWHDPKCDIRCGKTDVTVPPLVVLSMDGFAAEYLQRKIVTTLERMKECGTAAEFMYSSFPSKTFPNHYTMATGLYPEAHGIVDNTIYDPAVEPKLVNIKKSNNTKFYLGEPIWSVVERFGKKAACLFWVGCSVPRDDPQRMPTYNLKYNKSFSYSERIDTVINWLKLPMAERPSLIMAYFDQPDTAGHFQRSDEDVNMELVHMEGLLNYFVSTLYALRWLDCLNLIIVSDHGMHTLKHRVYFNDRLNTDGLVVSNGVIGRIHLADSGRSFDSVVEPFQCQDHGATYRIYNRSTMPVRFHYSATPRVGDAVFEGQPGTILFQSLLNESRITADHGFDYLNEKMHAIFFSRGPNIRRGKLLQPFQNIELFNLFVDLLQLPHDVPTNGTYGALRSAILNVNSVGLPPQPPLHPIRECRDKILFVKRDMVPCQGGDQCKEVASRLNAQLERCPIAKGPYALLQSTNPLFCLSTFCSTSILSLDSDFGKGDPSMIYEALSAQQLLIRPKRPSGEEDCDLYFSAYETDCSRWQEMKKQNQTEGVVFRSVAGDTTSELNSFHQMESLLHESFFSGGFAVLQNATNNYLLKYKRLMSISGTIFDLDMNGLADSREVVEKRRNETGVEPIPTHVFRILVRCEDGLWYYDGQFCQNPAMARILAFILPNKPKDYNCLSSEDYLMANTARIRDIELLTNVRFFSQHPAFPEEISMALRTNITRQLWN